MLQIISPPQIGCTCRSLYRATDELVCPIKGNAHQTTWIALTKWSGGQFLLLSESHAVFIMHEITWLAVTLSTPQSIEQGGGRRKEGMAVPNIHMDERIPDDEHDDDEFEQKSIATSGKEGTVGDDGGIEKGSSERTIDQTCIRQQTWQQTRDQLQVGPVWSIANGITELNA